MMGSELSFNSDLVFSNPARLSRTFGFSLLPRALPDFFIIGVQKGGTTSLLAWLCRHPMVRKVLQKEVFYFNDQNNYSRGLSWYRGHFPLIMPVNIRQGTSLSCDASANYFESDRAAQRIKGDFPSAKIILLLRNPVDRAFSHFRMSVARGFERETFENALKLESDRIALGEKMKSKYGHNYIYQKLGYRAKGLYMKLLQPWMNKFTSDEMLIIQSEKMFEQSQEVYDLVLNFLNLEPCQLDHFSAHNAQPGQPFSGPLRDELSQFYEPHNRQLERILNRSFNWS